MLKITYLNPYVGNSVIYSMFTAVEYWGFFVNLNFYVNKNKSKQI